MKVQHAKGMTFVQGKPSELAKIELWISNLKEICTGWEVVVDECDEYETSFTLICEGETQESRQVMAQQAKKGLK